MAENSLHDSPIRYDDVDSLVAFIESRLKISNKSSKHLKQGHQLESKTKTSNSIIPIVQGVNKSACRHPLYLNRMCVICGQNVSNPDAVSLGYINKNLEVGIEEMARLKDAGLKKLLLNKKLLLVLDLDHTQLHSTEIGDMSPDQKYLLNQTDIPNGSLFKVGNRLIKLRPFVRTFLKEASSMYEMYVYTLATRPYALNMAHLLDPGKVYFNSKVISQCDCTRKDKKGLDVVVGAESATIILDDIESVWDRHKENLILIEKYIYFASSSRSLGITKPLSESLRDESETDGALATVLKLLKRVHEMFFDSEINADPTGRDVREVLKVAKKEALEVVP